MKLKKNEEKIMNLIYQRLEIGRNTYGDDVPLNGAKHRDNLKEAIEEVLDLSVYSAAVLLEQKSYLNKYKKAYDYFMESWDKLPKENQSYLSEKLEELGL
jgi:mRNA-degrading endonuclease RelE of RelBE toxin-antitoxin system